jgi:hypothetical protein
MISQRDDELPDELVLAIQRVLDIQTAHNEDPLDSLSSNFDLTGLLNYYFPKGMSCHLQIDSKEFILTAQRSHWGRYKPSRLDLLKMRSNSVARSRLYAPN